MYRTIIVDDEFPARTRIQELCKAHLEEISIIAEADCGLKAVKLIDQLKPELIFLDIQMPDISGLEVIQNIKHEPLIIFTTAYAKYAIEAFETLSIDYLVKPIEVDRFAQSISKLNRLTKASKAQIDFEKLHVLLTKTHQQKPTYSIAIKKGDRIIFVDYEDISYLKSEDKYVTIITKTGVSHLSDKTLQYFESKLPDNFIRINRSSIINRNSIDSIEKYFKGTIIIHLQNGDSQKTGETYSKIVKAKLGI